MVLGGSGTWRHQMSLTPSDSSYMLLWTWTDPANSSNSISTEWLLTVVFCLLTNLVLIYCTVPERCQWWWMHWSFDAWTRPFSLLHHQEHHHYPDLVSWASSWPACMNNNRISQPYSCSTLMPQTGTEGDTSQDSLCLGPHASHPSGRGATPESPAGRSLRRVGACYRPCTVWIQQSQHGDVQTHVWHIHMNVGYTCTVK